MESQRMGAARSASWAPVMTAMDAGERPRPRLVSTERMPACAIGLRTNATWSMPGRTMSST